jgi:hypothetical protein
LSLFALVEFAFPAKSVVESLPQESEQFFRSPEIEPLAGINLFGRPFEPALCGFGSGSEPYYKSSSHED